MQQIPKQLTINIPSLPLYWGFCYGELMRLSNTVKQVLSNIAPLIGTAIGGPYGAIAGVALKTALGVNEEASDAEIEKTLAKANPETLARLKEANQAFEVKMRELGISEDDLYLKDVQDARAFAAKTSIVPQLVLAGLFIGGYFVILILMLSGVLSPAETLRDMALILLGVLAGEVPRIMSYFFGSTKGSSDKNSIMASAMSKK